VLLHAFTHSRAGISCAPWGRQVRMYIYMCACMSSTHGAGGFLAPVPLSTRGSCCYTRIYTCTCCYTRIYTCTCLHFVRPVGALGMAGVYVHLYVGVYVVDAWCRWASGFSSPVHQGGVLLHTHSHMHVLVFRAPCRDVRCVCTSVCGRVCRRRMVLVGFWLLLPCAPGGGCCYARIYTCMSLHFVRPDVYEKY